MVTLLGVYRISGSLDNPAPDPRFFENPVPVGFVFEIRLVTGFSRILIGTKKISREDSYKRVNTTKKEFKAIEQI